MRAGSSPPPPQQAPISAAVDAAAKPSATGSASNTANLVASHGVVTWSYVIVMALFLWALFVQKKKR